METSTIRKPDPDESTTGELSPAELRQATADDFPALPPSTCGLPLLARIAPKVHEEPHAHHENVHSYADAAALPPDEPEANSGELSQEILDSTQYLDFPFLVDAATKEYLKRKGNKLMIVLRGLPGSGKSAISNAIQKELSGVRVASADLFWMTDVGYVFNREKLEEAHQFCKNECEKFCQDADTQVVIVDNTNVRYGEFVAYLRLAQRYGFPTIVVEPKTPWRYDAQILFERNIHDVPLEKIRARLKDLRKDHIYPGYYGFFLSANDSAHLTRLGLKLARSMLQVEELKAFSEAREHLFANEFVKISEEDFSQWPERKDLLHCTAFFTRYGKNPGTLEYAEQAVVQQNLGKVHRLQVTGFLITPGTVSFRLVMDAEQLKLWNHDEDRGVNLPTGSRAHITIKTARGVSAAVAGDDTSRLVRYATTEAPEVTVGIGAGLVLAYSDDFWYLDLEKPLYIPALFGTFFTRDQDQRAPRDSHGHHPHDTSHTEATESAARPEGSEPKSETNAERMPAPVSHLHHSVSAPANVAGLETAERKDGREDGV